MVASLDISHFDIGLYTLQATSRNFYSETSITLIGSVVLFVILAHILEVNETLELELTHGEKFEMIAGHLFNRASRLVKQGKTFDCDGVQLRVKSVDESRITQVRIQTEPTDSRSHGGTEYCEALSVVRSTGE